MSKDCTLQILDEVNVKMCGVDAPTRRKLVDASKYFLPYARHTPAYKLGRWDGYIRYCNIGGATYLNMLDKLLPILQNSGYYITIEDNRQKHSFQFEKINNNSYDHISWPTGHQIAGQPIIVKDHQVEIVNAYLDNLQSLQCISTGSGKTLVTAILSDIVGKYGRTIVIVPNKDLVTQTEEDYLNLGLDTGVFYGDRKDANHQHVICTWQSIESLHKKSKDEDADPEQFDLDKFMDGVVCVIVDECHTIKGEVLRTHLTSTFANVPIRWGMTGTIPTDDFDKVSLVCSIGPIVNSVKAKDLQELGILSNLKINVIQTAEPYTNFTNYAAELSFLVTDSARITKLAGVISDIAATGNTLVLVDRVKTGNTLTQLIPESVFINGNVKSADRKKEYKEVSTSDNNIIVATYGVASTGINIPRIFNLIMIEPGKSFIRVIQTIGRGIRVAEDKDFVNVYDITSDTKYSKRHLTKRKTFYKQENYPFEVKKVNLYG